MKDLNRRKVLFKSLLFLMATTFVVAVTGCGGGGSSSGGGGASTPLTGSWVGPWQSTDPAFPGSGLGRVQLRQSGGNVSGTGSLTGSPCIVNAALSGIVSGNSVSINFVGQRAAATANLTRNGENQMTGTWRVIASNVCGGSGNVTLNRE